jgi:apolipoprotein D and lipocalin family protein
MKYFFLFTVSLVFLGFCAATGFSAEMKAVGKVNLERYLGKWYEIATIPQRFQVGCICVTAEYRLNPNGTIKVINSCHKDGKPKQIVGRAKVVSGSQNAKLKVSFFRPFWGDYWVVALDNDYQWAVVSNAKGSTCWILNRTPQMNAELYLSIVEKCRTMGIDVSRLVKTPQDCGK